MGIRTSSWPAGIPCWADLTVAEMEPVQAFYSAVLGWSFQTSDGEHGGYAIARRGDAAAVGIGPQHQPGPSAWTLYFATDDADRLAGEVAGAGGQVLLPPGDVGPMGRVMIATDPAGALFGAWQAGTHIGAAITNEPGGITWESLESTDFPAASAFYREVFGYELHPLEGIGMQYSTFHLPGDPAPLGGMGEGPVSRWEMYFGVEDADAAARSAAATGGVVRREPFDTHYGRMAFLTDPAGADFVISQNTGQPQPDRAG